MRCLFCSNPDTQAIGQGARISSKDIAGKLQRLLPYLQVGWTAALLLLLNKCKWCNSQLDSAMYGPTCNMGGDHGMFMLGSGRGALASAGCIPWCM